MKRLPTKPKRQLHEICTTLQQEVLKSPDINDMAKELTYLAIKRIHSAIDNEFKNANHFLKNVKG